MSRNRWNVLLAGLLALNLLRWALPLQAHPAWEEPPPAAPDPVVTTMDEEWEAMEVAGTNPANLNFVVVPVKHLPPPGHGAPTPQVLDVVGVAVGKGGAPGKEKEEDEERKKVEAMTSTLIVTKWRVRGHMHRARRTP